MTRRGLYEHLLTELLAERLARLAPGLVPRREPLERAEAADRIALHVSRVIHRAVNLLPEATRVEAAIALARTLLDTLEAQPVPGGVQAAAERPLTTAEVLAAIERRLPDGTPERIEGPKIPLLDTTLLTNAPGEPRIGSQLYTEIASADRIDLVMAFIRRSGLAPLLEPLRHHCNAGRPLRVLTTSYTHSTEAKALIQLEALGAEVRVSYDTSTTRLHAKTWLFLRESGFSTAYIGSSNLTHSALVSGLEWNVRVSGARNGDVIDKIRAVFESYWHSEDFRPFDADEFRARTRREDAAATWISPVEVRPYPFQEHLLEQIALSREAGHQRNLLVAATGTGKTVMAGLDYARLRRELPSARLLFVAHREEILRQSLATFRQCLLDGSFGELWVGGERPAHFQHVFASIQSLTAAGLDHLPPDHFDVVIVDEFHHAAAASYARLLDHLKPAQLLGLTATPERSDGLPVVELFGGRIAAELRLWDAIDQQRLCPFAYFGIHDGLDLRDIPWRRGRGYDTGALTSVLTANDIWARQVIRAVGERVDDPDAMRALGFCVSVEHARFMARHFAQAGIRAVAIWADTPSPERRAALDDLAAGRVNVVFTVDLFNEGVDVPRVDTLLLLRPTDSALLFQQQLGRGLRRADGKTVCTVLDFVGHHRREYRFDRRLRAILRGGRSELRRQVEEGFPFLPAGCHMELDRVAAGVVLENLRQSLPNRWPAKVEELRHVASEGAPPTLAAFLQAAGLDLEDVYSVNRGWSDLREAAGLPVSPAGPDEAALRRAVGRLMHVNDRERLAAWRGFLQAPSAPAAASLDERQRRLLRMLVASLARAAKGTTLDEGARRLHQHPQVCAELLDLFEVLEDRVDHVRRPLAGHPDVPLHLHARYSRLEILAAFGIGDGARVAPWQTGVYHARDAGADLLAFTLDKTSGNFSPTTRYRDYAISRDLIHWESQSNVREDSDTGRRYQEHQAMGWSMMLFARLQQSDRAFWFLGPADYLRHESEQPMAITWRLRTPLPGDLYAEFAAAVA